MDNKTIKSRLEVSEEILEKIKKVQNDEERFSLWDKFTESLWDFEAVRDELSSSDWDKWTALRDDFNAILNEETDNRAHLCEENVAESERLLESGDKELLKKNQEEWLVCFDNQLKVGKTSIEMGKIDLTVRLGLGDDKEQGLTSVKSSVKGFFKSMKEKREEKKELREERIQAWNEHIKKIADQNRIKQIEHISEYLELKTLENFGPIVFAKLLIGVQHYKNDDGTCGERENIYVNFYNDIEKILTIEKDKLPIESEELYRVLFKIIPFLMVHENEEYESYYGGFEGTKKQCFNEMKWNRGSEYDCDSLSEYSEKVPLSFRTDNEDSTVLEPVDVFIRKEEVEYLDDKALIYLSYIINYWQENNLAELAGEYKKWGKIKKMLSEIEPVVSEEKKKRGITESLKKSVETYGEKGEENVEYVLKWLQGYTSLRESIEEKIYLLDEDISDEEQEIDHIVVGENGVFLIETKYLKGDIKIDRFNNWTRTFDDGKTEGIVNPIQQVERHHLVVSSILTDLIDPNDIHDIICLAHESCTIDGAENSIVPVMKKDILNHYIKNKTSEVKYSEKDIKNIIEKLEFERIKGNKTGGKIMFFKNNTMIKDAVKEGEKPQGRKMNWEQGEEYSQNKNNSKSQSKDILDLFKNR